MNVFASKYFYVDWGAYTWAVRKWRVRRNKKVHNVYVQVGKLEVTVWYR